MQYKRVIVSRHGGAEVLQVIKDELSEPQPHQVRIKVAAVGVSFTDILIREGLYPGIPKVPFSPGYAIAGNVDHIGDAVTELQVGQKIVALTVVGGYSEYVCLPATECIPIPDTAGMAEAVCLVLPYVTAYQLLHRVAQVKAGDRILIHGAAGGVGTALLQLGRLAGLECYGTASANKHPLVQSLGGIPIDYRNEDFVQRIHTLTENGVDAVFDAIGGTHLIASFRTLRPGGQLVNYGFSSVLKTRRFRTLKFGTSFALMAALKLLPTGRDVHFYSITGLKDQHPEWFRADLTHLLQELAEGRIQPIISDRLPLVAAAEVHQRLERSAVEGQLVLICKA